MIVAAGYISFQGLIAQNYNITSCTWDAGNNYYDLVLAGISYVSSSYVTLLSTTSDTCTVHAGAISGHLIVRVRDNAGNLSQGAFSFMVLEVP